MQRENTNFFKICVTAISGVFWVAGLLTAGADSSFMPWINIFGLVLFSGASFILGMRFRKMDEQDRVVIRRKMSKEQRRHRLGTPSRRGRIYMHYA